MNTSTEGEGDFKPNPILMKILNVSGWYKTLVETMPEGILASDMNGIIVYANPKVHQMTGYSNGELLGKDSLEIVVENDRLRVRRESEKRIKEKTTSQYEITFKTKVGSKLPVIISGTPILGPNGESIGTYAIVTDIGDRKIIEKELREKNDELQTLNNNLLELYEQLAAIIADTTTIFTEIYLFTSEKCVFCPSAEKALQEVLASYGGKLTYKKVDIIKEPELAEKYDIMSLPTIVIGDEKLTSVPDKYKLHSALFSALVPEEKFRRTRQELDNLISNSPIAIFTINREGILTGVNPLVEIMTGRNRNDLIGENVLKKMENNEYVLPKSLVKYFKKGLKGEKISVNRLKIKELDESNPQSFSIISFNLVPLTNKEGETTEVLILSEDVTTTAIQEEQLAKSYSQLEELNEQLVKMNRERSDFVEVTTTGLLDPLRSSRELIDQILSGQSIEISEETFGTLEYLRNNLGNVYKSIMDILDFFTLEAQGYDLKPNKYRIKEIVSGALEAVGSIVIANKGFIASHEIPVDVIAWCDKEKIIRILKNLINNAIKFTEKDCNIHISARNLKTGFIEVSVKDNGIGIAKKDIKRIFDQYVKVDSKSPGSGLGLTVVKSLVEAHGGRVEAKSEGKNKGSLFIFTLPKDQKTFEANATIEEQLS